MTDDDALRFRKTACDVRCAGLRCGRVCVFTLCGRQLREIIRRTNMSARAPVSSEQSRRVFMAISSLCYVRTKDSVRYFFFAIATERWARSCRYHLAIARTHTHVYLNTIRRNIQIMCVCVCVPAFEKRSMCAQSCRK